MSAKSWEILTRVTFPTQSILAGPKYHSTTSLQENCRNLIIFDWYHQTKKQGNWVSCDWRYLYYLFDTFSRPCSSSTLSAENQQLGSWGRACPNGKPPPNGRIFKPVKRKVANTRTDSCGCETLFWSEETVHSEESRGRSAFHAVPSNYSNAQTS